MIAGQAAGFQIHDVHETDIVDAVLVEAVPACALGVLPVPPEVRSIDSMVAKTLLPMYRVLLFGDDVILKMSVSCGKEVI